MLALAELDGWRNGSEAQSDFVEPMIGEAEEAGLAEIHSTGDYLNHEALFEASQSSQSTDYKKRDFLFQQGTWRNRTVLPVGREITRAQTLIVGHSDITSGLVDIARIRVRSGYTRIFCANLSPSVGLLQPFGAEILPLGLSNPTSESELHKIYGDSSALGEAFGARSAPLQAAGITHIYANFKVKTSPRYRSELSEIVNALPHVKVGNPESTPSGRAQYLAEIRRAGLVVCPRGNGLDTHRLYETLYLGGIPIVLKYSYQHRICRTYGFPVIGLQTWTQLADFPRLKGLAEAENYSQGGVLRLRLSTWMKTTGLVA